MVCWRIWVYYFHWETDGMGRRIIRIRLGYLGIYPAVACQYTASDRETLATEILRLDCTLDGTVPDRNT